MAAGTALNQNTDLLSPLKSDGTHTKHHQKGC